MSAQPQFALIPVQLLGQVAQYLVQRPYIEVAQLIAGLGQLQAVNPAPQPEPEAEQPAKAPTET